MVDRREMLMGLAALAAVMADGKSGAQAVPNTMAVPAPPGSAGDPVLNAPQTFRFEDLPVTKTANGETRAVSRGVLPTGEAIEMHETRLLPGLMPHPPHKHVHSEFIMVREGTLEFKSNDRADRVGPGGVIFAASNIMHGLKNVGDTTANYFVIAIGRDTPVRPV